jgi:hypothetical protein
MTGIDLRQPSAHGWLVEKFAAHRNISHFEELLRNESDPNERRILESMLCEERTKLAAAVAAQPARDRGRVLRDIAPLQC